MMHGSSLAASILVLAMHLPGPVVLHHQCVLADVRTSLCIAQSALQRQARQAQSIAWSCAIDGNNLLHTKARNVKQRTTWQPHSQLFTECNVSPTCVRGGHCAAAHTQPSF